MGFFKDIYCVECNKKTTPLLRFKLADGNYLCSDCCSKLPSYITEQLSKQDIDYYHHVLDYLEYSNTNLKPKFQETHNYYNLHIDVNNLLFYIDRKLKDDTLILEFKHIADFEILYDPSTYKEGVIGDKVFGNVLFRIVMNEPFFNYEAIFDKQVKSKAKKAFFGSKISYENPKGMDEIIEVFNSTYETAIAIESAGYEGYQRENSSNGNNINDDLTQALNLFMFDSLDDVDLEKLKKQRNRLVKTFHPDSSEESIDDKFMVKINAAYEIIKKHLENN